MAAAEWGRPSGSGSASPLLAQLWYPADRLQKVKKSPRFRDRRAAGVGGLRKQPQPHPPPAPFTGAGAAKRLHVRPQTTHESPRDGHTDG